MKKIVKNPIIFGNPKLNHPTYAQVVEMSKDKGTNKQVRPTYELVAAIARGRL